MHVDEGIYETIHRLQTVIKNEYPKYICMVKGIDIFVLYF